MQNLENVSLIIVDCREPFGALTAIERSKRDIQFKEILFLSDKENGIMPIVPIKKITSKEEYSHFMVKELYKYINGTHCLVIQYDGYVLNPELWNDEWLQYDYVGARWNFYHDDMTVGNGGFSLRSKKLQTIIAQDPEIKETHPEDHIICRTYGKYLIEKYGIKFAPPKVADKFSDENSGLKNTFGYHGGFR